MAIIQKYLIPLALVIGFAGGSLFGVKMLAPKPQKIEIPPCPDCNCPPAVSLNGFDTDKLNNKKGHFHLHNHISDVQIILSGKDSVLTRELVRQAKFAK